MKWAKSLYKIRERDISLIKLGLGGSHNDNIRCQILTAERGFGCSNRYISHQSSFNYINVLSFNHQKSVLRNTARFIFTWNSELVLNYLKNNALHLRNGHNFLKVGTIYMQSFQYVYNSGSEPLSPGWLLENIYPSACSNFCIHIL